jgi:ketosteroid isomerase-like protein
MSTRTAVENYYKGIAKKDGWQSLIADDIVFTGPGSNSKGKRAYVDATDRFLLVVNGSHVKELIVEGNKAFALVHYDLLSPKGNEASSDVAELLTVKDEKINESTILFDTAAFREFMAKG